ncbi:hypothetical protein JL721_8428 [Aureococcus anophagefferens]|nr:hypothetical protein JL721_8428 [Aureococcus anophagefferens]
MGDGGVTWKVKGEKPMATIDLGWFMCCSSNEKDMDMQTNAPGGARAERLAALRRLATTAGAGGADAAAPPAPASPPPSPPPASAAGALFGATPKPAPPSPAASTPPSSPPTSPGSPKTGFFKKAPPPEPPADPKAEAVVLSGVLSRKKAGYVMSSYRKQRCAVVRNRRDRGVNIGPALVFADAKTGALLGTSPLDGCDVAPRKDTKARRSARREELRGLGRGEEAEDEAARAREIADAEAERAAEFKESEDPRPKLHRAATVGPGSHPAYRTPETGAFGGPPVEGEYEVVISHPGPMGFKIVLDRSPGGGSAIVVDTVNPVGQADRAGMLRRAYKKTSLKAHPDRGGRTSIFQKVKKAHDVLSDEQARRDYDAQADSVDFEKALHLLKNAARPLAISLIRPVGL